MARRADYAALLITLGFVGLGFIGITRGHEFAGWLTVGFFGICALITGYQVYFGKAREAVPDSVRPKGKPRSQHKVKVTGKEVLHYQMDGEVSAIAWDKLMQVAIVSEDKFSTGNNSWVLIGDDATGCRIPSSAQGNSVLLEAMETRLEGFDRKAAKMAQEGLEGSKILWRRA